MLTETRLCTIEISINDIKMILNSLNPTKACGPDNITIRMLLLCGDSIVSPHPLFCQNILRTGVYPDTWEEAVSLFIKRETNKL